MDPIQDLILQFQGLTVSIHSEQPLTSSQLIHWASNALAVQTPPSSSTSTEQPAININISQSSTASGPAPPPAVPKSSPVAREVPHLLPPKPEDEEARCTATWADREAAAFAAGQAAAARFLGLKAPVAPLASKLQPRIYILYRSADGHVHRPPLVFHSWAELRGLVEGGSGKLGARSVFQGFPSQRELRAFERGFEERLNR